MNPTLLARFAQLATTLTGMEFPGSRQHELARAVCDMVEMQGCSSAEHLFEQLTQTPHDTPLRQIFISCLTINETYFFRNRPQFEALATEILPEIIERRQSQRTLRIWSAACATGEEPYSVAILLDRLLPNYADWDISILATDIDRRALERAQQGVYGAWSFRQVDEAIRAQYFEHRGRFFEISPAIRRRVRFTYLNLAEESYPSLLNNTANMDLILCRNVLIYFGAEMARLVSDRLYRALSADGWLLVGHAEPSQEIFARFLTFNLPGTVAYRRQPHNSADDWQTAAHPPPITRQPSPPPGAITLPRLTSTAAQSQQNAPDKRAPADHFAVTHPDVDLPQLLAQANSPNDDGANAFALASFYASRRQWSEAEQWVGRALERKPMMAQAHYLHALLLLEASQTDAAITAARQCVYVDATFIAGHLLLALLHRRSGDLRRAINALTQARSLLQRLPGDVIVDESGGATARQLLASTEQQLETLNARFAK